MRAMNYHHMDIINQHVLKNCIDIKQYGRFKFNCNLHYLQYQPITLHTVVSELLQRLSFI